MEGPNPLNTRLGFGPARLTANPVGNAAGIGSVAPVVFRLFTGMESPSLLGTWVLVVPFLCWVYRFLYSSKQVTHRTEREVWICFIFLESMLFVGLLLVRLFVCFFVRLFVRSFVCLFFRSFIRQLLFFSFSLLFCCGGDGGGNGIASGYCFCCFFSQKLRFLISHWDNTS